MCILENINLDFCNPFNVRMWLIISRFLFHSLANSRVRRCLGISSLCAAAAAAPFSASCGECFLCPRKNQTTEQQQQQVLSWNNKFYLHDITMELLCKKYIISLNLFIIQVNKRSISGLFILHVKWPLFFYATAVRRRRRGGCKAKVIVPLFCNLVCLCLRKRRKMRGKGECVDKCS